MHQTPVTDIERLVEVLPPRLQAQLSADDTAIRLLEVVLDLGRLPTARFVDGERDLGDQEVTTADLAYITSRLGDFGDDNRAGITRTLHRISAIRNRKGEIIGLTCRVGRAVQGTLAIIHDLIVEGKSVLLLGRPGVGKTTLLREAARVLAEEARKRVVIVDTSNEIAGDGDVPHPGIGRARRMQVPYVHAQHAVMIEAVENHMPEVVVIDEIGTEAEAGAARTIAERGVQLIGTAHGMTLANLMLNPTLSDLVGGIQSVTLGDEEARRRGTQKTVLERKAPPTFSVLIELVGRDEVVVYPDVAGAVDALLRNEAPPCERRTRQAGGQIVVEAVQAEQQPLRGRETGSQPWDVAGHSFWWRNDTPQEPRKGKNRKGQRGPGRYRRVA
jgi:stage III sporulation protein SpoIIIAA